MATYETLSPSPAVTATAAQINQVCEGAPPGMTAAAIAEHLRWPISTVPNIILDSDIGEDPDDSATLCLLHALADRGECNILGTVASCSGIVLAQALQVINTYYGRPSIPVGYLQDSTLALPVDNYATLLANGWSNAIRASGTAPNATTLYRLLLANAPAASVTLLVTGYPRNLYHLYHSGADDISPLPGRELICAKVAKIVVMGGDYPTGSLEHNFVGDLTGVQVFNDLKEDAVTVVFAGVSIGTPVTWDLTSAPVSLPARAACYAANYAYYQDGAWDLLPALYAVRGLAYGGSTYFALSAAGKTSVAPNGSNTFTPGAGSQYYLTTVMSPANLRAVLEALLNPGPASAGVGHWSMSAGNLCNTEGRVGIGTTGPRKPLEINAADGYGLRIAYDDPAGTGANYVDIFCGSTGSAFIQGSGGRFSTPNAISLTHAIDVTQAGTAGTAYFNQIFQGSKYKKAVCYLNGFSGTYAWTFPTAFTWSPHLYGTAAALAVATVSTTQLTITGASLVTGWVIVEGY